MRVLSVLALLGLVVAGCADDPVSAPLADADPTTAQSQEVVFVDATGAVLERVFLLRPAGDVGEVRRVLSEPVGGRTTTLAMAAGGEPIRVNGDYCSSALICDRISSMLTAGGTPVGRWVRKGGETVRFEGTPTCQGVIEDEFGSYMYVVGQTGPTDAVLAFYYGDGLFAQLSTPTFDRGCDDGVIEFAGADGRGFAEAFAEGDRLRVVF